MHLLDLISRLFQEVRPMPDIIMKETILVRLFFRFSAAAFHSINNNLFQINVIFIIFIASNSILQSTLYIQQKFFIGMQ